MRIGFYATCLTAAYASSALRQHSNDYEYIQVQDNNEQLGLIVDGAVTAAKYIGKAGLATLKDENV